MKSPRISPTRGGLTLIEVVVAISILTMLVAVGLPTTWNFYLGYQIDGERDNLVALLRQARGFAISNINEADHGLYFDSNNFIVFEGLNFASRNQVQDEIIPRSPVVQITGPSELVFTELSGRTASSTYTLINSTKTRTINVNTEGAVDW